MSKDKAHIKYIHYHMIGGVYIGFTSSQKKFHKECKRLGIKKSSLECKPRPARLWIFENKGQLTLILAINKKYLPENTSKVAMYALIVHEVAHIWQEICEHIGEDNPSPELEAYHMQYLFQELAELYGREK